MQKDIVDFIFCLKDKNELSTLKDPSNIGEELEMPSPPSSHIEEDEPPNLESPSNNGKGCGSSTFEMTTIDGLVIGILLSLLNNIYIR